MSPQTKHVLKVYGLFLAGFVVVTLVALALTKVLG